MFKPTTTETGTPVKFYFEDEMMTAIDGDNVAAALLRAGAGVKRLLFSIFGSKT